MSSIVSYRLLVYMEVSSVIVVGDSPMTRTKLVEQRAAAVVSTLPVFVYIEPRSPRLRLGYICVAPHISVLGYLFIDP